MTTTNTQFDLSKFDLPLYDSIVARGLSKGLGKRDDQVCIEAAICQALGLPHGDNPECVVESARQMKIALNDKDWSSPQARAAAMRDLGIAQLGSKGVVNGQKFLQLVSKKLIRRLIPDLFRKVFAGKPEGLAVAQRCEDEGTREACIAAREYASASAAYASAAYASTYASAAYASAYAASAASASASGDYYLIMLAQIMLEVFKELKSPGCQLLESTS